MNKELEQLKKLGDLNKPCEYGFITKASSVALTASDKLTTVYKDGKMILHINE